MTPTAEPTIISPEYLRSIASYSCFNAFEDCFSSDPKKHPAWEAADRIEDLERRLAGLDQHIRLHAGDTASLSKEISDLQFHHDDEVCRLQGLLRRCRTVLSNMARENEGWLRFIKRWPISHEPLRSDARHLVPLIDEALPQEPL